MVEVGVLVGTGGGVPWVVGVLLGVLVLVGVLVGGGGPVGVRVGVLPVPTVGVALGVAQGTTGRVLASTLLSQPLAPKPPTTIAVSPPGVLIVAALPP